MRDTAGISRRRFIGRAATLLGTAVVGTTTIKSWLHAVGTSPLQGAGSTVPVQRAFYTMGSTLSITAYGDDHRLLHHAINRVQGEFRRLDELLSVFTPASAASRINRLAGRESTAAEPDFLALLQSARYYHALTNGAFDITVGSLMELWGFRSDGTKRSHPPTNAELKSVHDGLGMKNVVVDQNTRCVGLLHRRSRIDFGGIAVGHSVDRAVAILRAEGVEAAFINHSGDAYALGTPPEMDGWEVAIPNPSAPKEMLHTLRLHDCAISTSGAYEKFVRIDGRSYGHIFDPHSWQPAQSQLSTSIIAPTALQADALSTAAFCMDDLSATLLAKALPGVRLLAVKATPHGNELIQSS